MVDTLNTPIWKGPTIREIAKVADLGPATVDRVLNNRSGVREKTRLRVMAALDKLIHERSDTDTLLTIQLICESGESFNSTLKEAQGIVNRSVPGVVLRGQFVLTSQMEAASFADKIECDAVGADGVIIVAREHPAINRVVRKLSNQGMPVVCLTTDLPNSGRSAYVGNDQYAAGSVAALLIGNALPKIRSSILLVTSAPFRCQQEREMGFRRVLRSDFPHLKIEERVISDDRLETTSEQLTRHFDAHGYPAAVYNVAGANRGIAKALEDAPASKQMMFVGHELTVSTRYLLETGVMDYVISHDFTSELTSAAKWIAQIRNGNAAPPAYSQILLHTRYNCAF